MERRGSRKFLTTSGEYPIVLFSSKYSSYLRFANSAFFHFDRHGVHRLPNSMVYLLIPGKVTDYAQGEVNHATLFVCF